MGGYVDRTERFYKIEMMIRARSSVRFDELLAEVGVSKATLKRDLHYLRSRMDAPIVYDRFNNGYKLQPDPRDKRQVSHQLPGVWFSEREIHALLTMHQLIAGLDEGGVLARHLHPLLEKLHGMLGASKEEAELLMKRIKIISATRRPVPSKWFELFGDALLKRRRVHMRYQSRGRQALTERDVSPQRLVHYRSTWYLDAWCHQRDKLQRFALDAVESAEVLTKIAKNVAIKAVEAELDGGYGIFAGSKPQWATLVFSASAAQWISREEWHPLQETRWRDDGSYEMQLPYVNETELVMDVLRHGGQVRVEEPEALRSAVRTQFQAGWVTNEATPVLPLR
jgi:predicted DNA-binding transcriptional regulator YafY